jgi:Ala-tRNA(Pro) deacylase
MFLIRTRRSLMICSKMKSLLDRENIQYRVIPHPPAFTAQEIAHAAHVRGRELAKTVIVKVENWMAMVVLPASKKISVEDLENVVGTSVRLAREHEFAALFPDCEPGAMPPFGNVYGLDVYVDPSLAEDEEIAFNGGNHRELVRMRYVDFERLVRPRVVAIA